MNYLFLFTIGPVQSFIAQARTTRDLFAGSAILSELIDSALDALTEQGVTYESVFPAVQLESKPNRFLVSLDWQGSEEDLRSLGQEIERAVRAKWRHTTQAQLDKRLKKGALPEGWEEQVASLLEVYWIFQPVSGGNASYLEAQQAIERNLAAVKNARVFAPLPQDMRKCSVCGERTALVYSGQKQELHHLAGAAKPGRHILAENEALCSVCFAKRSYAFAEGDSRYPSTARVALMETLSYLQERAPGALAQYKKLFIPSQEFDEQLFFEENLTETYFQKNGLADSVADLDSIREQLKELSDILKPSKEAASSGYQWNKYYAVIAFDGDSMGELISGKYLNEGQDLFAFHQEFSARLGEFAGQAKEYLQEPLGRAVYAGGDDFLGFVNLDYLFAAMGHLRALYREVVSDKLYGTYLAEPVSFSAGVAVAHYKMPMSETLNWARRMEKDAKNIGEALTRQKKSIYGQKAEKNCRKDAWSVAVLKHSGEIHKTRFPFHEQDLQQQADGPREWLEQWRAGSDSSDSSISPLSLLRLTTYMLHSRTFSRTFINHLGEEFMRLAEANGVADNGPGGDSDGNRLHEMFGAEAKRLMLRANQTLYAAESRAVAERYAAAARDLLGRSEGVRNFLYMLQISEFITRGVNHVH